MSLGVVISELARRALVAPPHGLETSPGDLPEERNGLPLLPWTPDGAPVDLELVNQLRGTAQARQVDGVQLALQHNLGLGGACVVTLYGKN